MFANVVNAQPNQNLKTKEDSSMRRQSYTDYDNQEDAERNLIEDENSDIDERFYDALSEYDKNLFVMIKDKKQTVDYSMELRRNQHADSVRRDADKFTNKMIMITEFKGFDLAVNNSIERRFSETERKIKED
mmetsp:Transcript_1063/g.1046  ORF Transcript_1063/g.1046 Transcript_1063/m.1046 type:complete len:132 (+) Transcript_1063:248-643(+)